MPDECPEISGCECEANPFSYVVSGSPDDSIIEEITAQLSGLRWELPCIAPIEAQICSCDLETSDSATLVGDTERTYMVELRFRGYIEAKTYSGGTNDGAFFQTGGTYDPLNPYNIYSLEVSNPLQTYYLNRDNPLFIGPGQAIDYTAVVPMVGGATVVLRSQSIDNGQISNFNNTVVPGVAPDPAAFDGQFIEMSVQEIT